MSSNEATFRPMFVPPGKLLAAWTLLSALTVWGGLTLAERRATERCGAEGLAFSWQAWTCVAPAGTLVVPSGMRRV